MLNKYFIYFFLVFFLPVSIATCLEDNKYLLDFSKETFYSADFSQAFDNKEKEAVNGNIILKKPFFLKVSNTRSNSVESEIIINENSIYRIDYDLDQAVRYRKENIIHQIPAAFLLEDFESICLNSLKVDCIDNSCAIFPKDNTYISKIDLIFDSTFISKVKYTDAFGAKSVVTISNFISKPRLSPSVFSYNYEVKDLILLD
tara:strand:- start:38 stop:643 length:606 start_codon:yes stop_codon:yes gene_type:complete